MTISILFNHILDFISIVCRFACRRRKGDGALERALMAWPGVRSGVSTIWLADIGWFKRWLPPGVIPPTECGRPRGAFEPGEAAACAETASR
jgi:hypothetical protein